MAWNFNMLKEEEFFCKHLPQAAYVIEWRFTPTSHPTKKLFSSQNKLHKSTLKEPMVAEDEMK